MSSVLVSCVLLCFLASSEFGIGNGQMTYNVLDHGAVGDGRKDDSESFLKAWSTSCLDKGTPRLVIPGEKTYLLQPTKFSGPCQSSSIHVEGGTGYARRISFEEITLTATGHPIIIDQYYCPAHDCQNSTSSVQVSDVTFSGFHGTSKEEEAITLNCSQSVNCVNIVMSKIDITSAVPSEESGLLAAMSMGLLMQLYHKSLA